MRDTQEVHTRPFTSFARDVIKAMAAMEEHTWVRVPQRTDRAPESPHEISETVRDYLIENNLAKNTVGDNISLTDQGRKVYTEALRKVEETFRSYEAQ